MTRWTILRPADTPGRVWARCECGTERTVILRNIKAGTSRSCGCLIGEVAAANHTTHGMAGQPVYQAWHTMIRRCEDPRHVRYSLLTGAKIAVYAGDPR